MNSVITASLAYINLQKSFNFNLKLKTQNSKLKTQNSKLKTQNQTLKPLTKMPHIRLSQKLHQVGTLDVVSTKSWG
jgi:hypothetical protein